MTPGGIGLIEWIALGGELKRGWGSGGYLPVTGILSSPVETDVFSDTFIAGEVAQLWLDHKYFRLDYRHDDNRNRSVSTSGIVQTRHFNTAELYDFVLGDVTDIRGTSVVSDYSAVESFFDTVIHGAEFLWFPDYENYPAEYFTCILEKRTEPKRKGVRGMYDFTFNVRVATQFTSTVLSFT